jgi:hypothetical protein
MIFSSDEGGKKGKQNFVSSHLEDQKGNEDNIHRSVGKYSVKVGKRFEAAQVSV